MVAGEPKERGPPGLSDAAQRSRELYRAALTPLLTTGPGRPCSLLRRARRAYPGTARPIRSRKTSRFATAAPELSAPSI